MRQSLSRILISATLFLRPMKKHVTAISSALLLSFLLVLLIKQPLNSILRSFVAKENS